LCSLAGVSTIIVDGYGSYWNKVFVEGNWYNISVEMALLTGYNLYDCFMISDEQIQDTYSLLINPGNYYNDEAFAANKNINQYQNATYHYSQAGTNTYIDLYIENMAEFELFMKFVNSNIKFDDNAQSIRFKFTFANSLAVGDISSRFAGSIKYVSDNLNDNSNYSTEIVNCIKAITEIKVDDSNQSIYQYTVIVDINKNA